MNKYIKKIKQLSIKKQLIIIILFVSLVGLLLSVGINIYLSARTLKNSLIEDALLTTKLIGQYCVSPLVFEDKKGAETILKNIKTLPFVKSAILYNKKGEIFAFYTKEKSNINKIPTYKFLSQKQRFKRVKKTIYINYPIYFHKEKRGTILLIVSTKILTNKMSRLIINDIFILLGMIIIVYLITMKIQKFLSTPILKLAKISKEVSKTENYDFDSDIFKIDNTTGNEIDLLYSSYKEMLKQISERQTKLNIVIEALKESEEKYRRFFEQDVSAIFIATADGNIIDCNSTFENLFGYNLRSSKESLNFRKIFKNKEDYHKIMKQLNEEGQIKNKEIDMITENNKNIIALANIFIQKQPDIMQKHLIAYLFDITKRKQLEERFMHSQKMGSIGTFAGGIAHDFNNILTVIKGYSDLILNKIKEDDKIFKSVSVIKQSSEKAESLIKRLLLLGKKGVFKPKIFNINDTIKEINKILIRLIGENIRLKTELGEGLPNIEADQNQIEQVIINLIANARDALNASDNQDKEIIIKTSFLEGDKNYEEQLELTNKEGYVVLLIADNGIGMDEETKSKVFEPFFTTKDKGKGTGLGLSTVYGIVEQSKGSIHLYSEKGIGTTIKIYFPAVRDKEINLAPKKEKTKHKHPKGKTILLVEDDEEVRNFAFTVLTDLGYKVLQAEDGEKGYEIVSRNKKIDLILTDVIMPKMNGKDFVLKVREILPDLKVIFTSGYTDGYLMQTDKKLGEINFISKPYSYENLSEIISKVINS